MVGAPAVSQRRHKQPPGTRRVRVVTYKTVKRVIAQCEPPYVRFGALVSEQRHKLGWLQQDLADRIGLSRGSIANIETGRQRILMTDVCDFARVLGLDPVKMFSAAIKNS